MGPHDAVIYSGTDASNAIADVDDDESFFQHSLEEVKVSILFLSKDLYFPQREWNIQGLITQTEF